MAEININNQGIIATGNSKVKKNTIINSPDAKPPKKSRNWLGWIIALLVLAVISGLFYFYLRNKPGKEDLETITLLISAASAIVGIGGGLFKILKG